MNISLQALVAVDDDVDRALIDSLIAGDPNLIVLDYVEIGGSTSSSYGTGDVFIVACAEYTSEIKQYVGEAARQHPGRPIVLLCPLSTNGYLRAAFESGVDDVVTLPADHWGTVDPEVVRQLAFALQKAVVRKMGGVAERPVGDGRLICVLGLKGGAGKTLTSVNVGVALAQAGHRVALVDLDLQFGDLALSMGLAPERTFYDLVQSGGSLDADKLRDYMVEHSSGARVLLAPLRPDHAAVVKVPILREVLRLLRETHEYVVVDTPPNFTPEVIAAVDMSTDVLMVSMRDTLALKNTKIGLETLERMEYDRRRIRIVLNRANTKVGIDRQDVLGILGRNVDILVPSHRDVTRSVNQGLPIVLQRGAAAGKAFRSLAALYRQGSPEAVIGGAGSVQPTPTVGETPAAPPPVRRRSWLARGRS